MNEPNELFLPLKVSVYLTTHCNYSCNYCVFRELGILNSQELSDEAIEKIVYYTSKYQVPLVSICGGDPFLHPKLLDFIRQLSKNGNYAVVATNAVDCTKEFLRDLRLAGIRYLQIGLDSLQYSKLYNFKEDGHLKKVEESIDIIKGEGLKFGFATCVNHQNLEEIENIAEYSKQVGAELLKISMYRGENDTFKLTPQEKIKLFDFINTFNKENVFIKHSEMESTLQYISNFPSLTIYSDGRLVIDDDVATIGNIYHDNPAKVYSEYIKIRGKINEEI